MTRFKALRGGAAAAVLALSPLAAHAGGVILSNPHDGGSIGVFDNSGVVPDTGEVFTAPTSGTLDSLTFTVVGQIDNLQVGIAEWNGASTYTTGGGVSAIDYESAVLTNLTGDVTFNPNVAVTAGANYLFFLTSFGLPTNDTASNGVETSQTPTSGFDYIVYTVGDPNSSPWIYDFNYQADIAFTAHITTPNECNVDHPRACGGDPNGGGGPGVPEPAAWALMILGFGATGAALRRTRRVSAFHDAVA